MTPDQIIQQLITEIETAIVDFELATKALEKNIFNEIQLLLREVDLRDGDIKATVANIRKISSINRRIEGIVLNSEYTDAVEQFMESFEVTTKLLNKYFAAAVEGFTAPVVMEAVKQLSINETAVALTDAGINANVVDKVKDIISSNIRERASFYDLNNQVKDFIVGNDKVPGRLASYSKQITTDALNTYAAEYNKTVTDDLGLKWFKYVGALVKGSRPFCKSLLEKKYVHISELPAIARGDINGEQVSLAGLIPGTDGQNLQIRRGGYNCNHLLIPVSEFAVPEDLRKQFKKAA